MPTESMPLLVGLSKEGLTVADLAEDVRGYRVLVRSAGFIRGTPSRSPDGTGIAYVYDGGQVLGDSGPIVQWRLSVRSQSELSGKCWTDVNPDGKLQWVSGTKGLIYEDGDSTGPRARRVLLQADGTQHMIGQLSSNGFAGGFDGHGK